MIRIRTHRLGFAATALVVACAAKAARARGTAVLTGTIRDTVSTVPVPGAVITVTSPSLQGEQTVVTDASGYYRLAGLPPGIYLIRIEVAPGGEMVRYDAQILHGDRPDAALTLPRQWSPRIGVIHDPTGSGRSRIFASYARYHEGIPLDIIDRSFSGERQLSSTHDAKLCNPRLRNPDHGGCESDASRLPTGSSANPLWSLFGNGHAVVDPELAAESSDEVVLGGEYAIAAATRLGVTYTKRWQNKIIEDMSRDDATTFFVGNPGFGAATDFPMAKRDYDALTLYLDRAFGRGFLVQTSYTVSALRGNWAGLFRAETGQLDPNMSSDFDLVSLLPDRSAPLPGDHTHQLKGYAAKDFDLGSDAALDLGIAWRSRSGEPTTYLGSHPVYGPGEA